ncbi:Gfo/Idh/MocA family oxidoreductase [Paenibacillus hunanensis]|uniref:Gfo/Idh/MocA family protein n=1 Tax=Paenibacillus hunanensis TaxID=539262 RepID=UPI00202616CD|nr:Gfo/Idh/MocA family oxidoreductase [Paenibacillus hunanensis]MCL9659622.1 Gfo/Idh/MocA family oxidoreductase [Paenibacillus hunanensis]WPP40660.1 Gfo/Idh/MocA family oxidoreductase [Paenibacillus hunanensis]
MTKTIGIGVIGTGSISEFHLGPYARHEGVTIRGVCDQNLERAQTVAASYEGAQAYSDYHELLADPEIDAVSICTWNNTHAEISIAALRAGKHVLVEKPLCRTMEEAEQIAAAVKETGKLLMVGFVRRYDNNAQLLKHFSDQGDFGDIYYAKASYIRRFGNPGGWFSDIERSGGGPLIDIGVHVIDLCWYLMGRPEPLSVSGNTYYELGNRAHIQHLSHYKAADYDATKNDVEDMANVMIRFKNGASLLVDVSFSLHARENEGMIKLYGSKGGFEVDPALSITTEKYNTVLNVQPQVDHPSFQFATAFDNEIRHFIECVRTGSQPISPVEDGVQMMRMLTGIYESARLRREVIL